MKRINCFIKSICSKYKKKLLKKESLVYWAFLIYVLREGIGANCRSSADSPTAFKKRPNARKAYLGLFLNGGTPLYFRFLSLDFRLKKLTTD
ncbi:hypothetical protein B0A65_08625 [Flavobacterium frigidimaris]|uniref:Uncharacterized protein n=1 Tax=Flavobacterium frigidimaris TaxID=262320 RepID=A0ABX4BT51_FLAFR|nr:hypothetical protein B0A65_08625 [Flavobacterium frigidimaris]